MNTLIRNAQVVTAHQTIAADVLIEGEVIKEVRAFLSGSHVQKLPARLHQETYFARGDLGSPRVSRAR